MRSFSISTKRLGVLRPDSIKQLKEQLKVKIEIDKKAGEVGIESPEGDGWAEWAAEQVASALADGFEPKHAFKLLKDDHYHVVVDLEAAFYRNEKQIHRAKARIIGEGGKSRKMIESLTGTAMALPDNEEIVAIIGTHDGVQNAKEAVLRLLEG